MSASCQHSSLVMGLGFLRGCSDGLESLAPQLAQRAGVDEWSGAGTAPTGDTGWE